MLEYNFSFAVCFIIFYAAVIFEQERSLRFNPRAKLTSPFPFANISRNISLTNGSYSGLCFTSRTLCTNTLTPASARAKPLSVATVSGVFFLIVVWLDKPYVSILAFFPPLLGTCPCFFFWIEAGSSAGPVLETQQLYAQTCCTLS